MSELENNKKPNRDFSKFDNMSSEALNEILRHDLELDDEESDTEMLFYIMEVLGKREENSDIDTEASWEDFKNKYLSDTDESVEKKPVVTELPRRRIGRKVLRFAVSLAAAIALLMALAVTASAMGYDVFGAIATWTDETFRFKSAGSPSQAIVQNSKAIPDELTEFAELLDENGLDSQSLLPGYLNEKYESSNIYTGTIGNAYSYKCYLTVGDSTLFLSYTMYLEIDNGAQLEKDSGDIPEKYMSNGIEYYIMTNYGTYLATWLNGNIECVIYGLDSRDELIKIIESI